MLQTEEVTLRNRYFFGELLVSHCLIQKGEYQKIDTRKLHRGESLVIFFSRTQDFIIWVAICSAYWLIKVQQHLGKSNILSSSNKNGVFLP